MPRDRSCLDVVVTKVHGQIFIPDLDLHLSATDSGALQLIDLCK